MTEPLRRHQWQGTGGNGRALRLPAIAEQLGKQRRDPEAPMWLRELRRDKREQVL